MVKPRKVDLDKLKQKFQEVSERDSAPQGGDIKWWKPQSGDNNIRILPPWGNSDNFYREVYYHYRVGPNNKAFVCLRHEKGEACYLCELHERYRNSTNENLQSIAKDLKPTFRVMYNIVDRDHEEDGPQVYASGIKVFKEILGIFADPDYGDVSDVAEGIDIKLTRTGEGMDTRYSLLPRRKSSTLHDSQDVVEQWLEDMADLDILAATKTYEEMKAAYEGSESGSSDDDARLKAQEEQGLKKKPLGEKPSEVRGTGKVTAPPATKKAETQNSDRPPKCFGNSGVFKNSPLCDECIWVIECEEEIKGGAPVQESEDEFSQTVSLQVDSDVSSTSDDEEEEDELTLRLRRAIESN